MNVSEIVRTRRAVRSFSDRPVKKEQVESVLRVAANAPSGSNIQPWHVYVMSGAFLDKALVEIRDKLYTGKLETPEFPTYPEPLQEPYRTRRSECGERMYGALNIAREDKSSRVKQVMKNYEFFGAPVGLIITMEANMGESQALDIGIFAQTVMLAAREQGLDTCPQVSWTLWPRAVKEAVGIPVDQKVMLGMAMGYANSEEPVNRIEHPREPVSSFAVFRGF